MRSTAAADNDHPFEEECVHFFADIVQIFGIPRSVGQIYGLLYASPTPLVFSGIVERLEISKGSASQGLRVLRSLGAIKEVEPPADDPARRHPTKRVVAYEPELSLRQLLAGILRQHIIPLTSSGAERMKKLRKFAESAPQDTEFFLERAKQLQAWRRRITTVLPVIIALLGQKTKTR